MGELEIAENCDLSLMHEKFNPVQYAISFQNNSVYTDIFSKK